MTFLHSFEPGGVERIALRLVARWRAGGVDAPLFLGRADGAMAADLGRTLHYEVPRPRIGRTAWETPWMMLTLPRAIGRVRPDVLFCAGNTYGVVCVALKLLLGRDCPPIVAKVSNDLERRDLGRIGRFAYHSWLRFQGRFVDHVVAIDEAMRAEIVALMRVRPDAISVIPSPALSSDLIAELRSPPIGPHRSRAGRRFVAVGRLVDQKNLPLMLRAFHRAGRADDRLTIIGEGPRRASLEGLARKLGLTSRVSFRGYVDEPAKQLRFFDALLLSSDYEGVPAVLLEALAAGMQVVATDCSRSIRGLLNDGALGTIVPTGDTTAMADAISAVVPGGQDAQASLAKARSFTIEAAADAYVATFERVVALRKSNSRRPTAVEGPRRRQRQDGGWHEGRGMISETRARSDRTG